MATPIIDHTIGTDITAAPDIIFDAVAITTTAVTSDAFLLGQTMAGVELKVVANAVMTIPEGEVVTFEFQISDEEAGAFTTYATQTLTGATGGTVLAEGDELFRYIADRELSENIWSKLAVTPDTTSLASSINAYPVIVA